MTDLRPLRGTHEDLPALTDPRLHAEGDPHAVWAEARRRAPVAWHDDADHPPAFWSVTGYAAGLEVLTQWDRFSSAQGIFLRPDLDEPYPGAGTMLALSDPPRHNVLRRVVSPLFTPRAMAGFEARTRQVVGPLLDRAVAAGGCDFVTDVAAGIPLAVVGQLLSVTDAAVPRVSAATAVAAERSSDIGGVEAKEAHFTLLRYYAEAIERSRIDPGDDFVSALTRAQSAGLDLTDEEILLTCDNVIVAASETTRQAAGSGLLALLERPDQFAALRSGRVDTKVAADEVLRWTAPVSHILRTAMVDTELGGVAIRAGEAVVVWLPAANRDPALHSDGAELRLDRDPNRHLTFGGGAHFCLGAALARLIVRVLLEELVGRTRDIALDGPPRRIPSHILGGLESLPVAVR